MIFDEQEGAIMYNGFNPTEMEELRKALKKRGKFALGQWLSERTAGRVTALDDVTFEEWAGRVQFWSYPDLAGEIKKVLADN